jgi:mannose-6-phosphate isomerase-like protein (cupin superfamily)
MANEQSRRNFLRTAPLAAAVGLSLTDELLHASTISGSGGAGEGASAPVPFQVFTAQAIAEDSKVLQATPGNKNLVDASKELPVAIVLTTETGKSAKEFEWHEGRDHILQVVEGATVYEVGGAPKNARNIKLGEWLASESVGSTKVTLKKGDMLVIPRGTPHKRSTEGSVTFTLISPMGSMKA